MKFSQLRKVRSLAKKTLGSTRVGRAMRFPVGEGDVSFAGGGEGVDGVVMDEGWVMGDGYVVFVLLGCCWIY